MFRKGFTPLEVKNQHEPPFRQVVKVAPLTGFTLIELLIVIAIVAILATVVVLVINPVEILKESRDTRRIEDLEKVNKALSIYTATGGGNFDPVLLNSMTSQGTAILE